MNPKLNAKVLKSTALALLPAALFALTSCSSISGTEQVDIMDTA